MQQLCYPYVVGQNPPDARVGADSQANRMHLLGPSCSRPTFWFSQIMMITPYKYVYLSELTFLYNELHQDISHYQLRTEILNFLL
jgi:hypothetical protein